LTDTNLAPELVSHDRRRVFPPAMIASEATETRRTRRIRRLAVITLVILVLIAVGIDVIAFVILSPMSG
jgi:hypothetical protein